MPPQLQATGSTDRPHDDRHKVEEVVGVAAEVLRTSALPPLHFTVGVLNAVLKAYLLGAVPQHFWLYTTFQFVPLMMMLVPRWKAKGNLLYFAELCWVINFTAWLYLALEATSAIFQAQPLLPTSIRLLLARAFWSLANGPLALTVLMNHNAIVFHDVERTASFFIHFSPALVTWTMRWAPGGARLFAIPNSALPTGLATNWDLIVTGLGAYSCWWVPYTIWLIVIGHSLPDQGWGNSSFKDMRPKISSLGIGNERIRSQALVYSVVHAVCNATTLCTVPLLAYHSFELHTAFLVLLLCSAAYRGSLYYRYSFGRKLQKEMERALVAKLPRTQQKFD